MPGETDLPLLLATLDPDRAPGEYVFAAVPEGSPEGRARPDVEPFAAVREDEGLTLVLRREEAEAASLPFEGAFVRITLRVHSSRAAVGLTAAVAGRLAEAGIAANVLAGYYHYHVFVPAELGDEAVTVLEALAEEAGRGR